MLRLIVFQYSATLAGHKGSFKSMKKAFLNDPKCQKGIFWTEVFWIDFILLLVIKLNEFQCLAVLKMQFGSKGLKGGFSVSMGEGGNLAYPYIPKVDACHY